ncbi:MAG: CpaF family protein [Armatimonadia bacterium]
MNATTQKLASEAPDTPDSDLDELKRLIHDRLLRTTDMAALQRMNDKRLSARISELAAEAIAEQGEHLSHRAREQLETEVLNEVIGYGPIQEFITDPSVSEIMVNGPHQVVVERDGVLEFTGRTFSDDAHIRRIIEKIVSPLGRRIDESTPMVDARLPDGSRVNAIIPPLSLEGACLTIRKFPQEHLSPQDLMNFGTLSAQMCHFLEACVTSRLNIMVSGGTDSGKTTLLNVLSSFIPEQDRIVSIEDAAELRLQQRHRVRLESRPANIEGHGAITIRDLVRNALRMRPDRIIVGEVRGAEALDMLQAMNTGHEGSLSTLHSNSPRDTVSRLETMVMMAGMDLPLMAIREQIARALHLIVHLARFRDGSRRVVSIVEVQRMENDQVVLQDLFQFDRTGIDENGRITGAFRSSGVRPLFMNILKAEGVDLPADVFAL